MERAAAATTNVIKRRIFSLILFGIAFGYLEAAVVVYLRHLSAPIRVGAGLSISDLFPLTPIGHLGLYLEILKIEVVREAATLIMLAAVALACASRFTTWLAAFAVAFGVWDLVFYASLRVLIGWPQSLLTWDLLFLLPVPWTGPVLAPAIVATSLVAGGIVGLMRTPARVGVWSWVLMVLGAIVIVASFIWDWHSVLDGRVPAQFPWLSFAAGESLGIIGFASAWRTR